ncbi:ATP-binding protein [Streptomyces kasugaensis]|uniref:ATP-binding protein n=1 Tax=Streptomyces kasugaensis TaxID=1946 RepID=A0A4Q9HL24_STRKA|nr:ATP-binding protein [Streptomyces kasugaensis]TBO55245.1 ATP-binding protein [Streptomyces kasugaensis]
MPETSLPTYWRIGLPRSATAVPLARALVRTALLDLRAPAGGDTAERLTAELVTDAFAQARGADPLELVVELLPAAPPAAPGEPAFAAGPGTPPSPDGPAAGEADGRGLLLIRTFGPDADAGAAPYGKAVWFTLAARPLPCRH